MKFVGGDAVEVEARKFGDVDVHAVFALEAFVDVDEVAALFGFVAVCAVLIVLKEVARAVFVAVAVSGDLWALQAELVELVKEEAGSVFLVNLELLYKFGEFLIVLALLVLFVEDVVLRVAKVYAEKAILAGFAFGDVAAVLAVFAFLGEVYVVAVFEADGFIAKFAFVDVDAVNTVEICVEVAAVEATFAFPGACDEIAILYAVDIIAEGGVFMLDLRDCGAGEGVAEILVGE